MISVNKLLLLEIQTAKFGVLVTYTFGGKINLGLQQEFGKQILGPSPPDLLI